MARVSKEAETAVENHDGTQTTEIPVEVGIYPGLTYEQYVAIDAIRASDLTKVAESPYAYAFAKENGDSGSLGMTVGTIAHALLLEPHRFADAFAVWPSHHEDGRRAPRNGKLWDEFRAANHGKTVVSSTELESAKAIVSGVRRNPVVRERVDCPGMCEVVLVWDDVRTGARLKARLDKLSEDGIDDVKTTKDIRPRGFRNSAYAYKYYERGAFYHDGVRALTGQSLPVRLLAIENSAPFDAVVYQIPEMVIEHARGEYQFLLDKLLDCQASDHWPGYEYGQELPLDLPPWLERQIEGGGFGGMGLTWEGEEL